MPEAVTCPYCNEPAALVPASTIYPHRPDLFAKELYACEPCGAWVGCHPGTQKPLGRLANAQLRKAKMEAHAAFDPLWKAKQKREGCGKGRARGTGYAWLARQLGIPASECHIGMMDVAMCQRVVEICKGKLRA